MCLGMSFPFHRFLLPGLLAAQSSKLVFSSELVMLSLGPIVASPNTGKRWKWSRASVKHKLASTQTPGTEKLQSNRDFLPSYNGKDWFALPIYMDRVWSADDFICIFCLPVSNARYRKSSLISFSSIFPSISFSQLSFYSAHI